MMSLPNRVQRELEAANAAQVEYATQRAEYAAQTAPSVEAVLAAETPTNTAVAAPPPAPAPEPPKTDYEHKFKVLEGMYRADVTRTKEQLREVLSELDALKQAKAQATEPAQQLDPKDVDAFGRDLMEMVTRYTEGVQRAVNARLDALEQKVGSVATDTVQTKRQSFFDRLRDLVPDVETVNADPRWLVWLGEKDLLSGRPRQEALDAAQADLDAGRVAAIFALFKATLPAPSVPESLEVQVVPSGAGSSQALPQQQAKPLISSRSVNDFYLKVGRGQFVGNEAEMHRIEAEINLASAEGRIR
jgi:hypothetical protein